MRRRGYLLLMLFTATVLGIAGFMGANGFKEELNVAVAKASTVEEQAKINKLANDQIAFLNTNYFCSSDTDIVIINKKPCTIYYTLDGTEPNTEKTKYEKPITLTTTQDLKVVSIKAKAYYKDGSVSKTIVHTYYLSSNIEQRFDTLVFSVTTDPYNLYDYEYGIFVEGKIRDEYKKQNPFAKIDPLTPANYNMRGRASEREVYVEIIEPSGNLIASQAAGVRTYGGWSRGILQKSIKLFARKEYDEKNNKFRYEFFPNKKAANGSGKSLNSFKHLVLRGCGNDNGVAFIRDELFQTLAGQAGYKDYEAVRPVALFINGEYSGFYWLHEVYGDEYFEEHYGKYKGEFQILEGGELYKKTDEDGENKKIISDYDAMYKYSTLDLTNDTTYKNLCKVLDVENYLSYYALQIYIGNEDWPKGNYKTYRYYPAKGEKYGKAPFDGKWRYLLHDLDFSFGIYKDGLVTENISDYIGPNGEVRGICPLFGKLMQREDCKKIFIQKTMDLINGAFSSKNLSNVLDEMNASRLNEIKNMFGTKLLSKGQSFEDLPYRIERVKYYGRQRTKGVITKYQDYFDLGSTYDLFVTPCVNGKVKINSYLTSDNFEGIYFAKYNCTITATIPKGKTFDHWLVNGEKITTKKLVITPNIINNNMVKVTCVVK